MARKNRMTFLKRQKEQSRLEKAAKKREDRRLRKAARENGEDPLAEEFEVSEPSEN